MVDVDGVLIVHPEPNGWSTNLVDDLGVSPTALQEIFFAQHWNDVIHGRAALRERLGPALANIAPSVTCSSLIDYWFRNDAHFVDHLLEELGALRTSGFEVHLATVQEHERARYLWEHLDLQSRFDQMHYAADLGSSKPDPAFYRAVEARTALSPRDMLLIDDREDNVASARDCGWKASLWDGRSTVAELLGKIGWTNDQRSGPAIVTE